MKYTNEILWQRYRAHYTEFPVLGLSVDLSRMDFSDTFFTSKEARMQRAFKAMAELEKGAIANPDENRMVGHYWLRNAALAPSPDIQKAITDAQAAAIKFAAEVHSGQIRGSAGPFKNLLLIGIGGSALGPQLAARALGHPLTDKIKPYYLDNTDSDGIALVLSQLASELGQTLCLVISKSGGTKETRNGMLETKAAYDQAGLAFAEHAVAITGVGSGLDDQARDEGWIARFPMWDWVGGRTSITSVVGLLPMALQGLAAEEFLAGAKACDEVTRHTSIKTNPAAQLALMWYYAGNGKGHKDMVVIPYKDRLDMFSRYLQQLVMESLGKELDLNHAVVKQGIAVYGNKGSTDQHAYVQQLRDGLNNFFAIIIEVLRDGGNTALEVEPDVTSGDYLNAFLLGTRQALYEKHRESITLTIKEVSPFSLGVLIALFERAVGLYASLIRINAYHQPGVEAGKKGAENVLRLQRKILAYFRTHNGPHSLIQIAEEIEAEEAIETIFKICEHLAANPERGIQKLPGVTPFNASYQMVKVK
jgi:glucose-6-phosphate isomerase